MGSIFYCDGSCKANGSENSSGGFGVIELDNNNIIYQYQEFKSPTTNNEMELMAILHILKKLDKEKKIKDNNFTIVPTIYSDSAYCVNIINDWMYKWEKNNWLRPKNQEIKNLNIIKEIYNLAHLAHIEKVKGHSINKWNNYVDQLATGTILLNSTNQN